MKRIAAIICTLVLCMSMLSGCGDVSQKFSNSGKIKIVCTIFPQYDWIRQIIGEKSDDFEIKLLTENGADVHSYQPSVSDIAAVASCDILIYTGGESDKWIEDALKEAVNKNMTVINLMDMLGGYVKEEEIIEGMQNSEHEHEEHNHEDEEIEYDEHVWLSLKNAKVLVEGIEDALKVKDSTNASVYEKNGQEYLKELEKLDEQYTNMADTAKHDTVLFADRFPFRYLIDDYNLNYYAAFAGCSSETDASFETVVYLSGKVDELGLNSVLVIENSGEKVAQAVIGNTKNRNAKILTLNSMQSVTAEQIKAGCTYIGIMQNNLEILSMALNS